MIFDFDSAVIFVDVIKFLVGLLDGRDVRRDAVIVKFEGFFVTPVSIFDAIAIFVRNNLKILA